MNRKKALDIMAQLQAEYFYAFKDMPEKLFEIKVKNFMKALDGYSDKEIDIALNRLLKESEVCPTSACFVKVIEENRELLLLSAEEEWSKVNEVIKEMQNNSLNFNPAVDDWDRHLSRQKNEYNKLSREVKDFYINYDGFLQVVSTAKLEIEKNRFIKNFPLFRKRNRQKEELCKEIEKGKAK